MKISVERENIYRVSPDDFDALEYLTGGLIKNGVMTVDKIDFYYDDEELEYGNDNMIYFINGDMMSSHKDLVLGILQPVLLGRPPLI